MNNGSIVETNVEFVIMNMMPFHTLIGFDTLWFAPWVPSNASSTFGACVGLFLLSIFYRFTVALVTMNAIRNKANETAAWVRTMELDKLEKQPSDVQATAMRYPAFSLKMDLKTGLIEGLASFVGYFLMLAVMLMNAWFFIAIILGIVVGETIFGRVKRCVSPLGMCTDPATVWHAYV